MALLLLVARTNVAHLLLARGAARQRELAVRHTLGAARLRLLRQLVIESVVLATTGGTLAAVVGWGGLELLAAVRPEKLVALSTTLLVGALLLIHEVIVNRALTHLLWPKGDAIGRRFRNTVRRPGQPAEDWQTVIGIVPDVVRSLMEPTAQPAVYRPLAAPKEGQISLLERVHSEDAATLLGAFATSVNPGASKPVIENVRAKLDKSIEE